MPTDEVPKFVIIRWRRKYHNHRGRAKHRGINFLMTFEEWFKIWVESGHMDNTGTRGDQYCMARNGDIGPYVVGNVRIVTCKENRAEQEQNPAYKAIMRGNNHVLGYEHTDDDIEKMRSGAKRMWDRLKGGGYRRSAETRARISQAAKRRRRLNGKFG